MSHHTIWKYADHHTERSALKSLIRSDICVFCRTAMDIIKSDGGITGFCGDSVSTSFRIQCCPVCGWWNIRKTEFSACVGDISDNEWGNAGVLKSLNVADHTLPIEHIRSYLAARYEDRFSVEPSRLEDVVASVYRDLGFKTRVTGRTGDGGIDVVLDGPFGMTVGVQVKRYRGKIKVEQIHSLAGALVRRRLTTGMFVTTSSYQSGAFRAVEELTEVGVAIELVDARRFYDALGIAQRSAYSRLDNFGPFLDAPMIDLNREPIEDSGPYYVL